MQSLPLKCAIFK